LAGQRGRSFVAEMVSDVGYSFGVIEDLNSVGFELLCFRTILTFLPASTYLPTYLPSD
jgi:hypothetical protein